MGEPTYTCTRRTAEVFSLRVGYDYAVFMIDQVPERNWFALAIESSYGGYAYAWSHPGRGFYSFLAGIDSYYAGSKLAGRADDEFDGDKTRSGIRAAVVDARRAGDCTGEQARYEWELTAHEFESVGDFHNWMRDTELFSDSAFEYGRSMPGRRYREFQALYEKFWPAFAAELVKCNPPPTSGDGGGDDG